jgi:hypothetical protein
MPKERAAASGSYVFPAVVAVRTVSVTKVSPSLAHRSIKCSADTNLNMRPARRVPRRPEFDAIESCCPSKPIIVFPRNRPRCRHVTIPEVVPDFVPLAKMMMRDFAFSASLPHGRADDGWGTRSLRARRSRSPSGIAAPGRLRLAVSQGLRVGHEGDCRGPSFARPVWSGRKVPPGPGIPSFPSNNTPDIDAPRCQ